GSLARAASTYPNRRHRPCPITARSPLANDSRHFLCALAARLGPLVSLIAEPLLSLMRVAELTAPATWRPVPRRTPHDLRVHAPAPRSRPAERVAARAISPLRARRFIGELTARGPATGRLAA